MRQTMGLAYANGLTFLIVLLKSRWTVLRDQESCPLDVPPTSTLAEAVRAAERELGYGRIR